MNLRSQSEKYLGAEMSDEEYEMCRDLAEKKLNYINERYGANHGDEYLAMLISEQAQASRFAFYCDYMHRVRAAEKRKAGTSKDAPTSTHQHYNTRGIYCQEVI